MVGAIKQREKITCYVQPKKGIVITYFLFLRFSHIVLCWLLASIDASPLREAKQTTKRVFQSLHQYKRPLSPFYVMCITHSIVGHKTKSSYYAKGKQIFNPLWCDKASGINAKKVTSFRLCKIKTLYFGKN